MQLFCQMTGLPSFSVNADMASPLPHTFMKVPFTAVILKFAKSVTFFKNYTFFSSCKCSCLAGAEEDEESFKDSNVSE